MRLFTAIELPSEVREHLANLTARWLQSAHDHNIRKTATENLHITLRFLGEVSDAQLPHLCDRLAACAVEPATVFANRLLFFPPRGPIRIIAAGFGGETELLVRLHARVETACVELGFVPETRPFQPHATVARHRSGRGRKNGGGLRTQEQSNFWPGPSFRIDSFALMQSDLRPSGPVYTRIARFPAA